MKSTSGPASGFWTISGKPLGTDSPEDVDAWKADVVAPVEKPRHPVRVAAKQNEPSSLQNRYIRGIPSKQYPRGKILGVAGGIKKVNDSTETPYYNLLESWWCGNNGMTPEEREKEKEKALAKVKAEAATPFYEGLFGDAFGGDPKKREKLATELKTYNQQARLAKKGQAEFPEPPESEEARDIQGNVVTRYRPASYLRKVANPLIRKSNNESVTPFYDSLVQEDMTTADVASFELPLRNGGLSQQFDKELERRRKKKYYKLAMITASMGGAGDSY